jgi:hypothetical protein
MLKSLPTDPAHYGKLSPLLWKYGRDDIARQLGWKRDDDAADHVFFLTSPTIGLVLVYQAIVADEH